LPFFHVFQIFSIFNLGLPPYFPYLFTIQLTFQVGWIVKLFGNNGRKVGWKVKRYGYYGRKVSWIVKRFKKYRRKQWKDRKNMEEM
jgi:hypothetical protein